ncbi:hypothetical protein FRC12_006747 [Ceratobasidium sp. 428]|nr:hypothetical protein FRC12_006747 [Ceratobasidium sp. 428]
MKGNDDTMVWHFLLSPLCKISPSTLTGGNTISGTTMSEENMSAIMIETEAALLTPDNHPDKPVHLYKLGVLWARQYAQLGDISAIDNACAYLAQAAELTPEGHPAKPAFLNDLGST